MSTPPTSPGTPNDRLAAFFDTSQPCDAFDDVQIEEIAFLLARSGHCAQNAPRTYIVLRSIGRLDVLEQLLSVGFGDGWFPVEARSLPGFLEPRVRNEIVQSQRVILTKASNLEKGRHCHFGSGDSLPFTTLARLGSGAFGTVTRIESTITFRQYALKTIRRRAAFGEKSKQAMGEILSEMRIMQSLQHNHIVRYVGSFTNKNSFGILMLPVADQDLAAYLQDAATDPRRYPTVRTFFGCLATALSFLHDNLVKHRDIKPQNILMYQSKVLLTDFGLSRDYMDTSSGLTPASPRYCAPEVAAHESRNTSADVWSLGCVFLEILATLRGLDVEWLKEYYDGIGDGSTHYHANTTATESLLREWTATSHRDTYPLACTKDMLKPRRNSRPSAAEVAQKIMACDDQVGLMYSCSSCYDPDSDSDSMSSVVEKLEIAHRFPPVLRKPVPSPSMAQLTPAATQDSGSEPTLQLISGSSTASIITTDTLGDSTQEEATAAGPQPQAEESALSTPNTRSNDTSTTVSLGEPLADRPAPEDSSPTSPNPASIAPAPALASESSPSKIQSTPHAVITNHETDHVDSLRKEMQLAWEVKHKGSTSSENPFSILKTETEGNLQHRQVSAPSSQHLWAIPGVLDSYYGPESSSYIFRRVSGKTVQRVQQRSPQNQHQFVEGMQTKDGDDDIPLAILHKQQRGTLESIAQQELEDTESLGRRRGRLFGALNTRKKEADPGSTSMGAELEAPDEDTNMPQSKAIISRTQSAESELQTVLRLSPTGPLLSRAGDTSLPFVLPAELLTTHQSQPLPTKGEHIKVAKSRAKRTRVFGVDPCESVEYAGYDIGQIPFFIDSEVILIPGRVPFIFGKCIEVILQSQSTYTDKHTWRRDISFSDCLDFDKHRVTPNAVQVLLAAFDSSPDYGHGFDWYNCKASDVARFLQRYLLSLPETLIPEELSRTLPELKECNGRLHIPAHRAELQVYTQCLRKLKDVFDTKYRMLLCLIAFLATYAELGRGSERLPFQNLWVQKAARPYSLTCIIPCDPVLPTMCVLIANARHFLTMETGRTISDSDWTAIVNKGKAASDLPVGYGAGKRKLVSWQKTTDRSDLPEKPPIEKRDSRSFLSAWKGRKKKDGT